MDITLLCPLLVGTAQRRNRMRFMRLASLAICHALNLPDVLAFFTEGYAPPLNEAGMEKLRSYRDDLIATGKYAPAPAASLFPLVTGPSTDVIRRRI